MLYNAWNHSRDENLVLPIVISILWEHNITHTTSTTTKLTLVKVDILYSLKLIYVFDIYKYCNLKMNTFWTQICFVKIINLGFRK